MRALADAENARKRGDKARREAEQYGGSKLARDLLPVYDNMKRAVESASDEQKEVSRSIDRRCGTDNARPGGCVQQARHSDCIAAGR